VIRLVLVSALLAALALPASARSAFAHLIDATVKPQRDTLVTAMERATALIAAGKFAASPSPSATRAIEKLATPRPRACAIAARLHRTIAMA